MSWPEFLVEYIKSHPDVDLRIGLSEVPNLRDLSGQNFLSVKAVIDLLAAGVKVFRLDPSETGNWQLVSSPEQEGRLCLGILDGQLDLSPELDGKDTVVHQSVFCG